MSWPPRQPVSPGIFSRTALHTQGSAANAKNCVILRKEDYIRLTGHRFLAGSGWNIAKNQLRQTIQTLQHVKMQGMLEILIQRVLIIKPGNQDIVCGL
ncbi:MAG: hypothetical protein H6R19_2588 [Proteobacteria bacterium]|nr:hypothetical protein [Pseudomonadota bacterium]